MFEFESPQGSFRWPRKIKGCVEQDVVHTAVAFPKFSIEIVVSVVGIGPVEMD